MTRRTWTLLAMLVAALLLATCGGASDEPVTKAEYETALQSTMDDLEAAYGQAGAALDDKGAANRSVGEITTQLRSAQVALRDAGNRLNEIVPPTELASTHKDLVQGVRDMADSVDLLIKAQEVAERDPNEAKRLAKEFGNDDSMERVTAAAAALSDAGVDAGLLAARRDLDEMPPMVGFSSRSRSGSIG
jgi:hypothetical protein